MSKRILGIVVAVFCTTLTFPRSIWAALPADQVVTFWLREDPSDPNSRVAYAVQVSLTADKDDGNWIGWIVTEATVVENVASPDPDKSWTVELPYVDTEDGRWWVNHGDPMAPVRADFVEPPLIDDTATPNDAGESNLLLGVVGETYSPPPLGAPYEVTASLTYTIQRTSSQTPEIEGSEETSELPNGGTPPTMPG